MFDLVFLFTGLCAFVLDDPAQAKKLEVLLVDARTSQKSHRSVLVVRKDESESSTWKPSRDYGAHRGEFIEGFRITVAGVPEGPIGFSPRPVGSICPTTGDELAAYGWVPKLGKAMRKDRAGAVVELTNGMLATRSMSRYHDPETCRDGIAIWTFDAPGCPATTAFADVVEFRLQIATDFVNVELRDLTSNDLVHRLTLRPSGDAEVVVEIKNSPQDEICCLLKDGVWGNQIDIHFGELNRLVSDTAPNCVPRLTPAICPGPADHPDLPDDLCLVTCTIPGNPQCPGADQSGP